MVFVALSRDELTQPLHDNRDFPIPYPRGEPVPLEERIHPLTLDEFGGVTDESQASSPRAGGSEGDVGEPDGQEGSGGHTDESGVQEGTRGGADDAAEFQDDAEHNGDDDEQDAPAEAADPNPASDNADDDGIINTLGILLDNLHKFPRPPTVLPSAALSDLKKLIFRAVPRNGIEPNDLTRWEEMMYLYDEGVVTTHMLMNHLRHASRGRDGVVDDVPLATSYVMPTPLLIQPQQLGQAYKDSFRITVEKRSGSPAPRYSMESAFEMLNCVVRDLTWLRLCRYRLLFPGWRPQAEAAMERRSKTIRAISAAVESPPDMPECRNPNCAIDGLANGSAPLVKAFKDSIGLVSTDSGRGRVKPLLRFYISEQEREITILIDPPVLVALFCLPFRFKTLRAISFPCRKTACVSSSFSF